MCILATSFEGIKFATQGGIGRFRGSDSGVCKGEFHKGFYGASDVSNLIHVGMHFPLIPVFNPESILYPLRGTFRVHDDVFRDPCWDP